MTINDKEIFISKLIHNKLLKQGEMSKSKLERACYLLYMLHSVSLLEKKDGVGFIQIS
jgi:hypothetical protein